MMIFGVMASREISNQKSLVLVFKSISLVPEYAILMEMIFTLTVWNFIPPPEFPGCKRGKSDHLIYPRETHQVMQKLIP